MNTIDRLDGVLETWSDPDITASWLHEHRYTTDPQTLTPDDLAEMLAAREALRALCLRNTDPNTSVADAVDTLDGAARRAQLEVRFADHGQLHTTASGVDAVVGNLLSIAQAAMLDSTWRRLKACPHCGWVFHDSSRSRAGRWCTMTICGNRAKNSAYRRRHDLEAFTDSSGPTGSPNSA